MVVVVVGDRPAVGDLSEGEAAGSVDSVDLARGAGAEEKR
jgi:hypothetical protein